MYRHGRWRVFLLSTLVIILSFSGLSSAQRNRKFERVIIETPQPYDKAITVILGQGGRVTRQFKYINALAAEVPVDSLSSIRSLLASSTITKDADIPFPQSVNPGRNRNLGGNTMKSVTTAKSRSVTPAAPGTSIPITTTSLN